MTRRFDRIRIRKTESGWTLSRGDRLTVRSDDWEEVRTIAQRIVDRETRQAARDNFIRKEGRYV